MITLSRSERMVVVFLLFGVLLGLGLRHFRGNNRLGVSAAAAVEDENQGEPKEKDSNPKEDVSKQGKAAGGVPEERCESDRPIAGPESAGCRTYEKEEIERPPAADPKLEKRCAPVNINAAGEDELKTLSGIGPVLARRIVEYRNRKGPFQSPEDLQRVKGIGARKLERLKRYITINHL